MKRMIMAVMAVMMMGSVAMAQTEDKSKAGRPDKTEMIQKRTEAIALKYGLNDEQKAKLLELNTKYDGAMRMGMAPRGDRRMGQGRPQGDRQVKAKRDSVAGTAQERPAGQKMERGARGAGMGETMKKYDEELQTIMTPEQYQKYKEDMQKQRSDRGAARGGNRK